MKKILLITDSEDLQANIHKALYREYSVTICSDAPAAKEQLRLDFDGLILDLFLQDCDGLSLLADISLSHPPATIVLTRLLSEDLLLDLQHFGICCIIRMPCDIHRVMDCLSRSLSLNKEAPPMSMEGAEKPGGYSGAAYSENRT